MVFDFNDTQTINWIQKNRQSKKYFTSHFISDFTYVRCYHFGKIFPCDDFSEVLSSGNFSLLKKRAVYLFYDGIHDKVIGNIIANYRYSDKGKLYFYFTKGVIKNATTYILQGSENLCFIAQDVDQLHPSVKLKSKLFKSGKPVIFHINIPIIDFMKKNISLLYKVIIENDVNCISTDENLDFGPYIRKSIDSKNIYRIEEMSINDLLLLATEKGFEIP